MKNASEVKELFDNGKLNDFKGSKAIYVPDPCTRIPTTFPWCDCSACSNDTSAMTIHMRGEGKKERAESPKKYRSEKSALKNKAPGAMKPSDY